MQTIRLTLTQALVKYLIAQKIIIDGKEEQLFPAGFGIFGHGNVTCLAQSLEEYKDEIPTYRGQNEQSMAMAAIGFAKAKNRKQIMFATSSIGPGATNMITACGIAYTNSLPLLILAGDYFHSRLPSPVLQQIEQIHNPTISANDCFKPIVKYWDRITSPEQIMQSLPLAIETMLNPATCGPAFIGLCQDTQSLAYDFPMDFFTKKIHHIPRNRVDTHLLKEASNLICQYNKVVVIAGAGVIYSEAQAVFLDFIHSLKLPFVTTASAKSLCAHDETYNIGPLGILGSKSANDLLKQADLVIVVGSRLQDFTTASWSNFAPHTRFIHINTSSMDCIKHQSLALCGDARATLEELLPLCKDFCMDQSFLQTAFEYKATYDAYIKERTHHIHKENGAEILSYANIIGALNDFIHPHDRIILAAGGLPGEFNTLYKNIAFNSIDLEYGFSCMGYEISGGYGSAIANKKGENIVLSGDGSYMMLNSEIYSSVLTGDKMIIIVCDNGGYAVIHRLQVNQGGEGFNNLLKDCKRLPDQAPPNIDFIAHAKSMGADGVQVCDLQSFKVALNQARDSQKTFVISIKVSAYDWSEYSNTWWEVGVPEVSQKDSIKAARKAFENHANKQRKGV